MERNGESASKNHYVRRRARIAENKNGGIPPFYGCLQQNCQKIKTVISIFFVLSCEVGAHCAYGKDGAHANRIMNG